jgi:hypothetical protein
MYQISRALYRDLADDVIVAPARAPGAPTNRQLVLWACEAAIHRLATDRFYFARPARSLYRDIRIYFPLEAQHRVYRTVQRHLRLAGSIFASDPKTLYALTGQPARVPCVGPQGTPLSPATRPKRLLLLAPAPGRRRAAGSDRRLTSRRRVRALAGCAPSRRAGEARPG